MAETPRELGVRNLVSSRTREGIVEMILDGRPLPQMTVAEARALLEGK